jgi:hypothetical protein
MIYIKWADTRNELHWGVSMESPTPVQVQRACEAFRQHERRDAMYKTATFLIGHHWGRPADMADSLGVLLLTWNNAFYRYGSFDFAKLEHCIARNIGSLEAYRERVIAIYAPEDDAPIRNLFSDFNEGLAIADGVRAGRRSPVAVAKALHLLAPSFFPLWDVGIAKAYGCNYAANPGEQYLRFIRLSQKICRQLSSMPVPPEKTLLKMVDEYNYAKFTKRWV